MTTFENDIMYYMVKALVIVVGTLAMMSSCIKIICTPKKLVIALVLYLSWVGIYVCVALKLLGIVMMVRLCVLTISVPAMIILYFISNYSPWQAVFNYTMQISIALMIAVTQTLIVTLVGGGRIADLVIRITTYFLCALAEFKFLRKNFLLLDYLQDKSWRTLTFVPIGFTALLILIGTYPVYYTHSLQNTIYIYAVTAVMILVYVIIFHSLISQYNLQLANYTNTVLAAQSESFQKQLEAINSTEEQIKIMYDNELQDYTHWVACWGSSCNYKHKGTFGMWQYGLGKVAGVNCDVDYMLQDLAAKVKNGGDDKPIPTSSAKVNDLYKSYGVAAMRTAPDLSGAIKGRCVKGGYYAADKLFAADKNGQQWFKHQGMELYSALTDTDGSQLFEFVGNCQKATARENVNFRESPSLGGRKIKLLPKGTVIYLTGKRQKSGGITWVECVVDERIGWCDQQWVE